MIVYIPHGIAYNLALLPLPMMLHSDVPHHPDRRPNVDAHGQAEALDRDAADPLRALRDRFVLPVGPDGAPAIYLAGQSLGLQPKAARASSMRSWRPGDAWASTPGSTPLGRGSRSPSGSGIRWPAWSAPGRRRWRSSTP